MAPGSIWNGAQLYLEMEPSSLALFGNLDMELGFIWKWNGARFCLEMAPGSVWNGAQLYLEMETSSIWKWSPILFGNGARLYLELAP